MTRVRFTPEGMARFRKLMADRAPEIMRQWRENVRDNFEAEVIHESPPCESFAPPRRSVFHSERYFAVSDEPGVAVAVVQFREALALARSTGDPKAFDDAIDGLERVERRIETAWAARGLAQEWP